MIETILPEAVVTVEAWRDVEVALFPDEAQFIAGAVEKRRREFATARGCVRQAFTRLGVPPCAVISGQRGEPIWPSGVVGSITHCQGYRGCAVARVTEIATIGIDAEPHAMLPDGILLAIASSAECAWVERQNQNVPNIHWDRLLFSAKEAVYKAWYPLTGRWLDFEDAGIEVDAAGRTFVARLMVPGPVLEGAPVKEFRGRWLIRDDLVLTAVALAAPQ